MILSSYFDKITILQIFFFQKLLSFFLICMKDMKNGEYEYS